MPYVPFIEKPCAYIRRRRSGGGGVGRNLLFQIQEFNLYEYLINKAETNIVITSTLSNKWGQFPGYLRQVPIPSHLLSKILPRGGYLYCELIAVKGIHIALCPPILFIFSPICLIFASVC
jgi:hypothetical protein